MSARYDVEFLEDGSGYQFITSSGDIYLAYFTEFVLMDPSKDDIPVISFGFTCRRSVTEKLQRYDHKIKHTILHIIRQFFDTEKENAVLYMCINEDGKARSRHVTFSRWFNESGEGFEKYDSSKMYDKDDFYGSIIFKNDNPDKEKLINAFYFTIDYWGLNE